EGYLHNAAKSCGVDTQGVTRIAGQLLRNEAERKIGDKVEEKLEEKLDEQAPAARDAIRGLFNRRTKTFPGRYWPGVTSSGARICPGSTTWRPTGCGCRRSCCSRRR